MRYMPTRGLNNIKTVISTCLIGVAGILTMCGLETIAVIVVALFGVLISLNINKEVNPKNKVVSIIVNVFFAGCGLLAIIGGGTLVVDSASYVAMELGMSQSLVGLTIVAVGTSLPELVTSAVASMKKENDIAIGNVIGSNIFNVLLILGTTSSIKPLVFSNESLFDIIVLFVSGLLVLIISRLSTNMKKWQGIVFVSLYVIYLAVIILRNYF